MNPSDLIIPLLLAGAAACGTGRRVNVYAALTRGAVISGIFHHHRSRYLQNAVFKCDHFAQQQYGRHYPANGNTLGIHGSFNIHSIAYRCYFKICV